MVKHEKYVKNKPIKWCFKFWYRCASKTGYFYKFDLLGKNATPALTENTYCNIFSTISSTVLELLQSYLTKVPMQLEVLKKQERHARNDGRQKTWREAIANFCFPKKWLAVNAKKISINSSSQGLMQPKNDSSYHFWVQNVWRPNSFLFSLSVLSKTVENENSI